MEVKTWKIVTLVTGWQVAASLIYYAVFAATPFFRAELEVSRFLVGVVITAVTLGYAISLLPIGALTDKFGERRILTWGLLGISVAAVGVAVSWSYITLLVAVFLVGALYGTAMPGTNKAIFNKVPSNRLNFAMGVKQVGVTAGSGISAVLVTWIAGILFWEAGFYLAAGFAVAIAILFFVLYPPVEGTSEATYPDFRRLSQNRPYRSLVIAGFFLGAAIFTTTAYTVLYMEESIGTSVAIGGAVLALVQVTGSLGRVISGWICDRLPGSQRRRTAGVLLAQTTAGTVTFIAVMLAGSELLAAISFAVLGFFVLGNTGVYYSCLGSLVSSDEVGGATGGGQLAITSGGLFVPPLFGLAADTVGYWASWTLLALLVGLAGIFIIRVFRTPAPNEKSDKMRSIDSN